MPVNQIEQLYGAVQNYAWGKVGSQSMVAKLSASSDKSFQIDEDQPYAELWMGAHIKAPSKVVGKNKDLDTFINENISVLGFKVQEKYQSLPYLFKVLSVAKALSIQAHPNKKLAEKLHLERPDIYKDPNHKPEMAIALTEFEALCGFRPVAEILTFLELIPELAYIVGEEAFKGLKSCKDKNDVSLALKACFSKVIFCDKELIKSKLNDLVCRIEKMTNNKTQFDSLLGGLLLKVNKQFPSDVGCFVIYFLNYICLKPGEALFLKANIPHAYLAGDCVECMACSDNVVRAGLTPKLIDAETLCEMLDYSPANVAAQLFKPIKTNHPYEVMYNPPVDDFAVSQIQIPSSCDLYEFAVNDSASIVLFIEANAFVSEINLDIVSGTILFIPSGKKLIITNNKKVLMAYRATCIL